MDAKLLFVHTLSLLHAGTGQGVGVIDLPIAREKATNLPYLPGSSLKGVLRAACQDEAIRKRVYGPDTKGAPEHAGSVHFTDQRLLLLPVRSLRGTFAWVTSPFVLRRFLRDAALADAVFLAEVPEVSEEDACLVPQTQNAKIVGANNQVVLEDIPLSAISNENATTWARELAKKIFPSDDEWQQIFQERFCIVHDEVFGFLVETGTEVVARTALKENEKTVAKGALWYEESLPAESILSGLVVASPVKADVATVFKTVEESVKKPLQLGGNATVGRGLCWLRLVEGGK